LKGIGGCPLSGNELIGNIDTEKMIEIMDAKGFNLQLNDEALVIAARKAATIFH
jgi:hydroxymethylglutaryl-CoA lyase